MNLYAILPGYAPGNEVRLVLAENEQEAMEFGVFYAAKDACEGNRSLNSQVYEVASDVRHIGQAWATDAPREWTWANPGVFEVNAAQACHEAEDAARDDM